MGKYDDCLVLQVYGRAPAPMRDYCGLTITEDELILNVWNITYGPHVYPKRQKCLISDIENDRYMQSEVSRLFGQHVLNCAFGMANKQRRLENLPSKIFLKILNSLAVRDIRNLSQTSKIFFELCNMESAWKIVFKKFFKNRPIQEDSITAETFGWKRALLEKIQNKCAEPNRVDKKNSKTAAKKPILEPARREAKGSGVARIKNDLKAGAPKSLSAINTNAASGKKINATKSAANLIKIPNQQPKIVNNLKALKNTNVKIEVPKELQHSIDSMKKKAGTSRNNLLESLKNKPEKVKTSTLFVNKKGKPLK